MSVGLANRADPRDLCRRIIKMFNSATNVKEFLLMYFFFFSAETAKNEYFLVAGCVAKSFLK